METGYSEKMEKIEKKVNIYNEIIDKYRNSNLSIKQREEVENTIADLDDTMDRNKIGYAPNHQESYVLLDKVSETRNKLIDLLR